jgi:hypothetical protein
VQTQKPPKIRGFLDASYIRKPMLYPLSYGGKSLIYKDFRLSFYLAMSLIDSRFDTRIYEETGRLLRPAGPSTLTALLPRCRQTVLNSIQQSLDPQPANPDTCEQVSAMTPAKPKEALLKPIHEATARIESDPAIASGVRAGLPWTATGSFPGLLRNPLKESRQTEVKPALIHAEGGAPLVINSDGCLYHASGDKAAINVPDASLCLTPGAGA